MKSELESASHLTVVFDGSMRLGEAFAVVVRYMSSTFTIEQRLIRVHTLQKSLTAKDLAREIITAITSYQVPPTKIAATLRDGAAVNAAAVSTLKDLLLPNLVDITCLAHSLDNVGRRFETPLVDEFCQRWVTLFGHSPAARITWKSRTGVAPVTFSATCWWSSWEVLHRLVQFFW